MTTSPDFPEHFDAWADLGGGIPARGEASTGSYVPQHALPFGSHHAPKATPETDQPTLPGLEPAIPADPSLEVRDAKALMAAIFKRVPQRK